MAMKLVAGPVAEPISLAQARQQVVMDADLTADDALLQRLIVAARMHAENRCRRALVTQTWRLFLDAFPAPQYSGIYRGNAVVSGLDGGRMYEGCIRAGRIDLPLPPLQAVASIKYYDDAGTLQTLDPALYQVDDVGEPGAVLPAPGAYWPQAQRGRVNAVQIEFTAGYGAPVDPAADPLVWDPAVVPENIQSWMLVRVAALYENREEIAVGPRLVVLPLPFIDHLLDPSLLGSYA